MKKIEQKSYNLVSCLDDEKEFSNLLQYINKLNDDFELDRINSIMNIERNKLYSLVDKIFDMENKTKLNTYLCRCETIITVLNKKMNNSFKHVFKRC